MHRILCVCVEGVKEDNVENQYDQESNIDIKFIHRQTAEGLKKENDDVAAIRN